MKLPSSFTSGIDLVDINAPGGIERLLDFHRQTFGDAVMEATGDAPAGGDTGAPAATGAPSVADAAAAALGGETDDKVGKTDDSNPWADPEKAKAEIEKLRKENGASRTTAKENAAKEAATAVLDKISVALGLKDSDKPPTADELAAALTAEKAEAQQAKVELAVYKAASAAGGDPSALLDSRAFLESVKGLDPAKADFQGKVTGAIKEAVKNNPKLKAVQAAAASAVDHAGGTGEKQGKPTSLTGAVEAAYAKS